MTEDSESTGGKRILKATLEAVFSAQERLRKHLDVLILENRCMKDDNETALFYRELTYATLGLGVKEPFVINVHPRLGREEWGTVEYQARSIARMKENQLVVRRHITSSIKEDDVVIPIRALWDVLLQGLLAVFPKALDRATGLSREQDSSGKSMGHMISDE